MISSCLSQNIALVGEYAALDAEGRIFFGPTTPLKTMPLFTYSSKSIMYNAIIANLSPFLA